MDAHIWDRIHTKGTGWSRATISAVLEFVEGLVSLPVIESTQRLVVRVGLQLV